MSIRTKEDSCRSRAMLLLQDIAKELVLQGVEAKLAGDIKEGKTKALLAYDVLQVLKWLQDLDDALCPNVEECTYDDLIKKSEEDRKANPSHYTHISERINAELAARKEAK